MSLAALGWGLAAFLGLLSPESSSWAEDISQPAIAGALPTGRQFFPGQVPPPAARAQPLGRVPATDRLRLALTVPLRNGAELAGLVKRLYDPASADYHRYLTPEQFTEEFGPTPGDYQRVIEFARTSGLAVTATHSSRMVVELQGAVAEVEKAFHVTLRAYQHPTEPRQFRAPDVEPSVAAGLPVLEISGLSDYARARPMSRPQRPGARAVPAVGSAPGGNYMGMDFRNAYAPGVSLDGTGQMVGLVEFDGYNPSDITAYETLAGLPPVPLINVSINGFSGMGTSSAEVSLDIEMALAMAPGLDAVVVFEAPDDGPGELALLDSIAATNQIQQFSCSWGFGSSGSIDAAFLKLAAQGQTLFYASGDSDAYVQPQSLWTESPYATSVGGTSLTMSGSGAAYGSETVWNWGSAGSSGGVSASYWIPEWQQEIDMTANHGSTTLRNLPDVALTADSIWVTYGNGLSGSFEGTSCAAPLWAGFIALVNQQRTEIGNPAVGFLNPALYWLGQAGSGAACFNDITNGNNTSALSPDNYYAVPGYDLCTGWGTPAGTNLINALAGEPVFTALPVMTAQPQSLVVNDGANAVFQAGAIGSLPFSYQWQFNGANLAGATTSLLAVNNAQSNNSGLYQLLVANAAGSATSAVATLVVVFPPAMTAQPASQTATRGATVTFTAAAEGTGLFDYQWVFNGTNLPNKIIATVAGNGGTYSGDGGAATSAGLNSPTAVAFDASGNLYIADPGNNRIRKVGINGIITTVAGRAVAGFAGDGGPATNAALALTTSVASPSNPPGGIAVDAMGALYISDSGNHRVRRVDTNGIITTVAGNGAAGWSGDGGAATNASLAAPGSLALDAAGALYIVDPGTNCIRRLDTNGSIITVAGKGASGFSGDGGAAASAALSSPSGVALDGLGNLYIADSGNNRIRKVDGSGLISTVAGKGVSGYSGDGGAAAQAGLFHPCGLAFNARGELFIADSLSQRIRKVDTNGIITTVAGKGLQGFSGDGGPATATNAMVNFPAGLAFDASGNLYIADENNRRIRKLWLYAGYPTLTLLGVDSLNAGNYRVYITSPYGNTSSVQASLILQIPPVLTSQPVSQAVGVGSNATLSVTLDSAGPFEFLWYFAGTNLVQSGTNHALTLASVLPNVAGNYNVVVTNAYGRATSQVATVTVLVPPSFLPSLPSQPASQTVSAGSTVSFSASVEGSGLLTFQWRLNGTNLPNNLITTVAGNGVSGHSGDGGAAGNASLNAPTSVALDAFGNLFVADSGNRCVRKVDAGGVITTVAGNGGFGYTGDGGPATDASLKQPSGVAVDAADNLYIADVFAFCVREVGVNGIIATMAGNGVFGYSGDGGAAAQASFKEPSGMAVDAAGNLLIADYGNNCIRKVDPGGFVTTVAGNGRGGYSGNGGAATNASLNSPRGVAVDAAGNLFIADYGNSRIRKVDTGGLITTVAGNGTNGYSGDGGRATNACLYSPAQVAADAFGDLFIADYGNNRIRKLDANGVITTVAGGTAGGFSGDGGWAANASLAHPSGVALDAFGNLYVADSANNRIRKVTCYAGYPRLTLGAVGPGDAGDYTVVISSPYGSVTSAVATLTVAAPRPPPVILTSDGSFGFTGNQFGFNLLGPAGQTMVVESSADLLTWTPLLTNAIGTAPFFFSEPVGTNHPRRFYRARLP